MSGYFSLKELVEECFLYYFKGFFFRVFFKSYIQFLLL